MAAAHEPPAPSRHTWRTPGGWLAAVGGLYLAVNAGWAFTAPASFAARLGLPLDAASDAGWVLIYALRTALLVAVLAVLLLRGQLRTLSVIFALAVLVSLGDALLTWNADAAMTTVIRHVGTAVYLSVAAMLLRRDPT